MALRYILEAWEEAVYDGLDPDCVATAAIFAALSDMIATYGEEPVAVMAERLPQRIRNGEFTVMRHLHLQFYSLLNSGDMNNHRRAPASNQVAACRNHIIKLDVGCQRIKL